MSEITISRRYAQALGERAAQAGVTDRVDQDISLIGESLKGSRELVGIFESPIVSREKKADVFRSLFAGKIDDVTLRFLEVLVEKRREDLFPVIVGAYQELRDKELGVLGVSARTALALSPEDEKALASSLEKLTGKKIRLSTKVDASLLGGIVIRVGDTVYDASVSNQLATLRVRLEKGALA